MKSINQFPQAAMSSAEMNKVRGGQLWITSKLIIEADGTRTTITQHDRKKKMIIKTKKEEIE
jgi:hypothetical protein